MAGIRIGFRWDLTHERKMDLENEKFYVEILPFSVHFYPVITVHFYPVINTNSSIGYYK